eukprot:3473710-Prymnesium_polylepis.1
MRASTSGFARNLAVSVIFSSTAPQTVRQTTLAGMADATWGSRPTRICGWVSEAGGNVGAPSNML